MLIMIVLFFYHNRSYNSKIKDVTFMLYLYKTSFLKKKKKINNKLDVV